MKVLSVIGTRPEAVKMAPVVLCLRKQAGIESLVLVTGQHRQMVDQVLKIFQIHPDYDLNLMEPNQVPALLLAKIIQNIQPILQKISPDWILVQGDTTTVLGAALAGSYTGCKVAHIEAGLRTYDRANPFPEELNRVLVDHLADLCFAPTQQAYNALLREGIAPQKLFVTGNTIIDALHHTTSMTCHSLPVMPASHQRLLVFTTHRRENHGEPLVQICNAIYQLAQREDVHIIFPVHPHPHIRETVHQKLKNIPRVTLLDPLAYLPFVHLLKRTHIVLTDSGGIQEEAASLGIPTLILRTTTERPEVLETGVARLVGTDTHTIITETNRLLDDPVAHCYMAHPVNVFGDGQASQRIVDILFKLRFDHA